ncbi:MAG: hypothetical protein PQJ60_09070, partial [Spirochaetales bacterium]|nr:hypothetical protein [Spirochaetales bacterium]
MPSIDAVDRIKKVVNSLGNEEAILQQKGVAIEDVLPPSDEMDGDLQDLLSTGPEEDGMTTMDSLLSSLDAELPEEDFPLDILSEDPENDLALTDAPLPPTDDFDLPDDDILGGLDDLDLADEGDVLAGLGDLDLTDEGDALAGLGDLDLTGEGETLGELGDLDLTGEGETLGELDDLDLTG